MLARILLFLTSFFLCGNSFITAAQDNIEHYNKALIWRGYEHAWTYNHRLNRLGSYVKFEDGQPIAVHASATGLGSDSTDAITCFSYVETANVCFKEAEVKIQLAGDEGDLMLKEQITNIDLEPWMQGKEHYGAILNGFEIRSIRKADQLQMCSFEVENPQYIQQTNQIQLTTHFNLVTNCRTIECSLFKNKTSYELTLHVLLFAYDGQHADFNRGTATRSYEWDTQIEVIDEPKSVTLRGQKDVFNEAIIGICGLSIILDSEHWLLDANHYVLPLNYDAKSGEMLSQIYMKYVEWSKGMEEFAASKFKSSFAKRRSGFAMLNMDIEMVQFKNANVLHSEQASSLYWKGWNKDASAEDARSVINITDKLIFKP
jgi:hypothetical protein